MEANHSLEEKISCQERSKHQQANPESKKPAEPRANLVDLQKSIGNRAVQCLVNHSNASSAFELDEDTTDRINRGRSGGVPLDAQTSAHLEDVLGTNFEQVRIHTNPEADTLNRQLSANAFTTGHDIFFRQGMYEPGSQSGQKLIAHELTHIVQQASGVVGPGGNRMTVHAPSDRFEKQADRLASEATSPAVQPGVQRQVEDDEQA